MRWLCQALLFYSKRCEKFSPAFVRVKMIAESLFKEKTAAR